MRSRASGRPPCTHHLKCWPDFFQATVDGLKTFEFRRNDRGFLTGDFVVLYEWSPKTEEFTGRSSSYRIGYMLTDMGVPDGYCVFAITASAVPPGTLDADAIAERERS